MQTVNGTPKPQAERRSPFIEARDAGFDFESLAIDYDGNCFEEPDVPVIDGVLFAGDVMQIAGHSKVGKTWFVMQLAWCTVTGRPFLGWKTTKGRVLYVNYELKPKSFRRRSALVAKGLGIPRSEGVDPDFPGNAFEGQEDFDRLNLRGTRKTFDEVKAVILKLHASRRYSLIIFDPLYRTLKTGASERSDAVMTDVLCSMGEIAGIGPAVVFVHHYPKGDRVDYRSLERSGGSAVIGRFIDSNISIDELKANNCSAIEPHIREGSPMDKIAVRFTERLVFTLAEKSVSVNDKKRGAGGHGKTAEDLVKCLPVEKLLKPREIHDLCCIPLGLTPKQVDALRDDAKRRGMVIKSKTGGTFLRPSTPLAPRG